jgi:hypothetical protein
MLTLTRFSLWAVNNGRQLAFQFVTHLSTATRVDRGFLNEYTTRSRILIPGIGCENKLIINII